MKWIKKGKILDNNSVDIPWFKKNAMMPLPYMLDEKTIRIFLTMCDEENVGRIGYIDVDANDPKIILGYSKEPVIDTGTPGTWDDNGAVTGSLYEEEGRLYLFYSGYQICSKIPYMIFSGVAMSLDHGNSFTKLNRDVPLLDRIEGERNLRCVPNIIRQGNTYHMYYHADYRKQSAWCTRSDGKMQPVYSEKHMTSRDLLNWDGNSEIILEFENDDEHGLSISSIWYEENMYKCIYSIRSLSKGYRLGYAESSDGVHFVRKDNELNLDVSPNEFDSEMMCFAKRINFDGRVLLFYSGNHYGIGGIGYAELVGEH